MLYENELYVAKMEEATTGNSNNKQNLNRNHASLSNTNHLGSVLNSTDPFYLMLLLENLIHLLCNSPMKMNKKLQSMMVIF